jgi:3-oxoacyl-[acyl-carrier protein] reductase
MDLGLEGRVALVTGASGGIGRAIATLLHDEGATVVAHGHQGFGSLAAWCEPLGIHTARADLGDPIAVDAMFDALVARHGHVDLVAANAGRWPEPDLRLDETPLDSLRSTVDDNLWTAILTARAWMRRLSRPGGGLVFTGSTAGRFGEPFHAAYATSKAALHGLVRTLKNEVVHLEPSARVNLVEPGWTATPVVAEQLAEPGLVERVTRTMPLRRVAEPEDVARAIAYLLSPIAARHVTGEVITVAGGMEGRLLWPT